VNAAPTSLTGLVVLEQGTGLFELLDANGDGRLSIRELRNAAKRLADLDLDGDGFIAKGEIPRQVHLTLTRGAPNFNFGRGGTAARLVTGREPQPVASTRGPLWFRKMDLNGDGDISPREWLGTPELFKLIDEDGDGLISVEEAERYERRRQKDK
jgi:hypothetical protein